MTPVRRSSLLRCLRAAVAVARRQAARGRRARHATHPPGAAIASAHALATDAGLRSAARRAAMPSTPRSRCRPCCRWSSRSARASAAAASSCCTTRKTGTRRVRRRARDRAGVGDARRRTSTRTASSTATAPRTARGRPAFPGLPAALVHVAQKYGRLPLATTLAPAIRIAREGFPVYARLANAATAARREVMERYRRHARGVPRRRRRRRRSARSSGSPTSRARWNCWRRRASTASTAAKSRRSCSPGVKAEGGHWTADGTGRLPGASEREPLRFDYRGWDVVTAPPPSSGGIALARDAADARRLGPGEARRGAAHAPGRRGDAPRLPRPHASTWAIRIS